MSCQGTGTVVNNDRTGTGDLVFNFFGLSAFGTVVVIEKPPDVVIPRDIRVLLSLTDPRIATVPAIRDHLELTDPRTARVVHSDEEVEILN
jgi:hypothetical protein